MRSAVTPPVWATRGKSRAKLKESGSNCIGGAPAVAAQGDPRAENVSKSLGFFARKAQRSVESYLGVDRLGLRWTPRGMRYA